MLATSEDVPGPATEAATIEILTEKLRTIIPEFLMANGRPGLVPGASPVARAGAACPPGPTGAGFHAVGKTDGGRRVLIESV